MDELRVDGCVDLSNEIGRVPDSTVDLACAGLSTRLASPAGGKVIAKIAAPINIPCRTPATHSDGGVGDLTAPFGTDLSSTDDLIGETRLFAFT